MRDIFLADPAGLTRPRRGFAARHAARVPSDARCQCGASVECGQHETPIRPAAGVGLRRVHRNIRHRQQPEAQAGHQSNHPLVCLVFAESFHRRLKSEVQSPRRASTFSAPKRCSYREMSRCACIEPTPAAGRIALAIWPSSTLARLVHLASEGTRAGDTPPADATTELAQPGQQEKCPALVRIVARKHQSGRPRAFRPPIMIVTTGRAAEARVTGCEIKASLSRQ